MYRGGTPQFSHDDLELCERLLWGWVDTSTPLRVLEERLASPVDNADDIVHRARLLREHTLSNSEHADTHMCALYYDSLRWALLANVMTEAAVCLSQCLLIMRTRDVCTDAESTGQCVEAAAAGILFYSLYTHSEVDLSFAVSLLANVSNPHSDIALRMYGEWLSGNMVGLYSLAESSSSIIIRLVVLRSLPSIRVASLRRLRSAFYTISVDAMSKILHAQEEVVEKLMLEMSPSLPQPVSCADNILTLRTRKR